MTVTVHVICSDKKQIEKKEEEENKYIYIEKRRRKEEEESRAHCSIPMWNQFFVCFSFSFYALHSLHSHGSQS